MSRLSIKHLPLLLAFATPLAGCQTTASQISSSGTMGPDDTSFIKAAYTVAQLDERAGKLAATKAADPRVVDLAAKMSAEAQVLYPNLQGAMQAEQLPIPTQASDKVQAQLAKLDGLSGPAFDRAFVAAELDDHQRAVGILRKEDATTKDGALKTQVETELPAVQGNLDALKFLSGNMAAQKS